MDRRSHIPVLLINSKPHTYILITLLASNPAYGGVTISRVHEGVSPLRSNTIASDFQLAESTRLVMQKINAEFFPDGGR